MEIKYTLQGLFIYLTMAHYLVAFVLMLLRRYKTANAVYFLGFVAAIVCYVYRWYHVAHVPMQNLFEVFLTLGLVIYPISLFCKRYLRIGDPATLAADMLIGFIVLFPTGFKFSAEPQRLPPALQSWLFAPHVAVYMLSYMFMAKAAVQAVCQLMGLRKRSTGQLLAAENATYSMVCVGFPFLTLGLILGSWWGKIAWGDYWGWDPKELWSLASWLFFVGYLHFRHMFGKKHAYINSLWAISGLLAIILTLLWANLSRLFEGLHSYA
jgi:ABC-type transport system involved in cytochrome c biogenesis permease subunit